jgi:CRISPR-associated endonuclease/helicase Cas3
VEDVPKYVAHISDDGTRYESVHDHLNQVAEMAATFAESFGASEWARVAGLTHDIGKYSQQFQNRILHGGPKVDHSTAGACVLDNQLHLRPLAYCVAGHHGGLPDAGSQIDDGGTLFGRLKKAENGGIPAYEAYGEEINLVMPVVPALLADKALSEDQNEQPYAMQFLTRMVFSCLVDADFLCTERFVRGGMRETLRYESLESLGDRLETLLAGFRPARSKLGELRCAVSDDCIQAAQGPSGLYSLTAPTGSGKTYSLLRFALQHACRHGMSRVICAEPYTSIIEQNAQVYRDVLGEENVLEHHSGFDFDSDEFSADGLGQRLRLAAENWDAPVIVTTNVQLFESLYSNKTSRCRKLHNIANSVIVLDEAQMIPTDFLIPCVKALAELVKHYGCTVLLSSATQPALESFFEKEGLGCAEIISDTEELFSELRRVTYRSLGSVSDEELADCLAGDCQALCIVNSRKQARVLYEAASDRVADVSAVYHLTTLMYPEHRARVLAEIRERVRDGEPCIVVATSLVEAGVDLDFPVVYRAVAGVDSMIQAAGRCNREGKRLAEESIVYLFESAESYSLPREVSQRAEVSRLALPELGDEDGDVTEMDALETVESFFNLLYSAKGKEELDRRGIVKSLSNCGKSFAFDFATVARDFSLIEDGSFPVTIPTEDITDDIAQLEQGIAYRSQMRRISRRSVSLYKHDIEAMRSEGAIHEVLEGLYLLDDVSRYSEATGLNVAPNAGEAFFW